MVVETLSRWLPAPAEAEVASLRAQLLGFHGYRTVWVDAEGAFWHAEPEELLEELGHRYVGTFLRPSVDELIDAVAKALPWKRAVSSVASSQAAPAAGVLAPA